MHTLFFNHSFITKLLLFTDMLSFAISNFSDTFIESMNQDEISFKSQFILESFAKKDPGFTLTLTHDSDNKVIGIVWMTSYMRDNFERFGDYISIDVMHSSICNAKGFCYIALVINNELEKSNVVCKGFVISETHDVYTFVWIHYSICVLIGGKDVHTVFF